MRLFEYEAKKMFQENGIPIPKGGVAESLEEAERLFRELGSVVIKSQVLVGGRGKAGGIQFAENDAQLKPHVKKLLGSQIGGFTVRSLLIEEKLDIASEVYLGVTIERSQGKAVVLASGKGGIDIEELARTYPDQIIKELVDVRRGIRPYEAADIVRRAGLKGKILTQGARILGRLYDVFWKYDGEVAEINPLAVTREGGLIAADAKINVDDEALKRHPDLRQEDEFLTDLEREARTHNLGYVEMDGEIGVIGNGAGLNMTTLDILRYYGGEPANFLEVSGRTYMKAEQAIEIVLKNPKVKVIFGNFFGSISRCDVIAQGLAEAIKKGTVTKPLIVSMRGNGAEEGRKILSSLGIPIYENDQIAGEKAVEAAKRG
ncbi:MAG: ADP-forming succinate--CoA ligase subunit beta [Proteobacteria bacterium]|nr:ADP-forming succinate--CoA ligase subunit beta [Pseudomonadota bacterium]